MLICYVSVPDYDLHKLPDYKMKISTKQKTKRIQFKRKSKS